MSSFHKFYDSLEPAPKLKLKWEYDKSTFSSWLMSEITKDLAKDLHYWYTNNTKSLPFNSLFKDEDTRVIIPFTVDPEAASILDKIYQNNLTIDFETGMVRDGKRQTRLGKYILNKTSPFSKAEKEWWNHRGNGVEELKAASRKEQYAIVVSRNPIDIVRMSDHDGWTSCHAPSREYFQCAISDAKGAGAVAYVVKKDDLSKINLQDSEIFADKKRGVEGVTPISRIRLRKFVHKKDKYDLAVPEERTYGKQFPGLEDSVRNWALKSQQDKLKGQRPRMSDFELVGGSYHDTQAGELFNKLFGDDLDKGDADYGGDDEYENMFDQVQEEVEAIKREYQNKFTICTYYADVYEGDDYPDPGPPQVNFGAIITLEIPVNLVIKDINFSELRKWANSHGIHPMTAKFEDGKAQFHILGEEYDADGFRTFLEDVLKPLDDKAFELKASFYQFLINGGYAKANKVNYLSANWDDHPHQFTNFVWEGEDPEIMISLKNPLVMPHLPPSAAGSMHEYKYWQDIFTTSVKKELNAWADRFEANQKSQLPLFKDPEFQPPLQKAFNTQMQINPKIWFKADNIFDNVRVLLKMSIEFDTFSPDQDVDDAIEFVTFLDKNYQRFCELLNKIYIQTTNMMPKPTVQPNVV